MVTNDLGEFRVSDLMPGTYVLRANLEREGMWIAGGIVRGRKRAATALDTRRRTIRARSAPEQAEPITVGVGDVANVSFALSTARLTRVSGTVRDSQGRPVPAPTSGSDRARRPADGP